ncbi:hypothetical protein M427DRAFT_53951 [Gonapodya prolifera JEL478]|uniref:Uncharacterized protein n=1 Tax=Gonapodya prolifera (strain JEL478) TaxID=1344416 RepID=A0A139AMY9_GONPJ|nr:hypothetical protein M427DRAFT_53951 [Gonapodya prolifera JEL478]|eukprot:KXS18112.1 hypothetical protein M427DRAFT_53951 [Gonapodya prolifera JEL478]
MSWPLYIFKAAMQMIVAPVVAPPFTLSSFSTSLPSFSISSRFIQVSQQPDTQRNNIPGAQRVMYPTIGRHLTSCPVLKGNISVLPGEK